jgi:uncharacterized membrane protein
MRRVDPLLDLASLLALAGGYAAYTGAPVALRTVLGLPLVTLLPGYVLSKLIFGARLARAERLLMSLALTLATDVLGGIALSVGPWGIHARSWAVLLAGMTFALALLTLALPSTRLRSDARIPWRPSRAFVPATLVAMGCSAVCAIAIAADRRATPPPSWVSGYTLFWILPNADQRVEVGLESGELAATTYRVELRSRGRVLARWSADDVDPSQTWRKTLRVARRQRIDAYLYRADDGAHAYRHVYLHGQQGS